MIWKAKSKELKYRPRVGDIKKRTRFAFFPVKLESGSIVWLQRFTKCWIFKNYSGYMEVEVTSGGFEDIVVAIGAVNSRTRMKKYDFNSWTFYARRLWVN